MSHDVRDFVHMVFSFCSRGGFAAEGWKQGVFVLASWVSCHLLVEPGSASCKDGL